jgi:hypothetical protein
MTSSLDRLDGAALGAVLAAAYTKSHGLTGYKLPKKYAYLSFLADGIADESAALCASRQLTSTERVRKFRAKRANETPMKRDETHETHETHRQIDSKTESETRTREVSHDLIRQTASKLGIPQDFADYFEGEMAKLDWRTMGQDGRTFSVAPMNVAQVMRNWWGQEKRKNSARASGGVEPAADVPTVTEGDLIS